MRAIKKLAEDIEEEIESAKEYAEEYIEHKAKGDLNTANHYKEMANDELKHAMYLHERAVTKIAEVSKTFTPPVEMEEKWEKAHKEYVEAVSRIKHVLAM